jgi:hypothetical protein
MRVNRLFVRPRALFPAVFDATRLRRLGLFLALILCANLAAVAQRINFPATYLITHVSTLDQQVQLTLTLTIHNFSGKDIQDCGIVLYGSSNGAEPIGTFDLVKLFPTYKDITVSHQFSLSQAEYSSWQHGVHPSLDILLSDGHGGTRIEAIDARLDTRPVTHPVARLNAPVALTEK